MDIKRARLQFWISLGVAVVSVSLSLLFALTLFYQTYRDGDGRGLYVLSQFFPYSSQSRELAITSPFDKGEQYYNDDKDRRDIEEMLARYYLDMRYTYIPDVAEMTYRWGPISPLMRLSTPAVHRSITKGKDVEDFLNKMPKNEVRTIEIQSFERVKERRQFNVNMYVYTLNDEGQVQWESYQVLMDFAYSNARKRFDRDFTNPYGLYFYNISETKNNY